MLEYLKELLDDLKFDEYIKIDNRKQKYFALDTAIEVLENLRNQERSKQNGSKTE